MYNASDKPKGLPPLVTGSPSPQKARQGRSSKVISSPIKQPVIANRPLTVPPLKLDTVLKQPVISSPDNSPPSSPLRSPSPSKVLRSISEKTSAIKVRVEHAVSPRAALAAKFEGIE